MDKTTVTFMLKSAAEANRLVGALSPDAYEPAVAETVDDLYQSLSRRRTDVLVIENELVSFFSGLDVLRRVNENLIHPKSVLIAKPSASLTSQARQIGIDRVLDSPPSPAVLKQVVEELSKTKGSKELEIPAPARRLVEQACDLQPVDELTQRLAGYLLSGGDVSRSELARDIAADPRATADVLVLANSSTYQGESPVTSVLDAVVRLGLRCTMALLVSSRLGNAQRELCHQWPVADRSWCFGRGVLMAATAHGFAEHVEKISPDAAYVVGLFQDVGILGLGQALPGRYQQIVRTVRQKGLLRLEVIEQEQLGFTHADVGAAMLEMWGLPSAFIEPVLKHHRISKRGRATDSAASVFRITQIAEALANLLDGHIAHRMPILRRLLQDYDTAQRKGSIIALEQAVDKTIETCELFRLEVADIGLLRELIGEIIADKLS